MPDDTTRVFIRLSGRRPVTVDTDDWPRTANGHGNEYDGETAAQSVRTRTWWVSVRQHADGRALVYGVYEAHSKAALELDVCVHAGKLLDKEQARDLEHWIVRVANDLFGDAVNANSHVAEVIILRDIEQAKADCLASLPAEEL